MKAGTSVYSRPTTAKKAVLSPKTKPKQRIKTEAKDLDFNQLCELIDETIGRQKECEIKGKYVEAEAFKRKVKALKEQLEDKQMEDFRLKHERQLQELHQAHMAQMNLFSIEWQKRIEIFNLEIEKALQDLKNKHERQIVPPDLSQKEVEDEMEQERKFHQSPKLLELRKIEQELGRQENYIQAHRVQQKANKLEKEEMEKHQKNRSNKKKLQLTALRNKQESELSALKMRIQMQVQERQIDRMREEDTLKQKYQNILKETEYEQNQELINLNKKVKLNQLQKKSKVGTFSISKG